LIVLSYRREDVCGPSEEMGDMFGACGLRGCESS
jgi:hypothetical protein